MGDHGDVEMPQNRFLGFAIKQELERRLDATLRRVRAHRQSLGCGSCHGDVMAPLAVSCTDDNNEFEWIAVTSSLNLDHSLPSPHRFNLAVAADPFGQRFKEFAKACRSGSQVRALLLRSRQPALAALIVLGVMV